MVSRRVLVVVLLACVAAAATEEVATISNADGNLLLSPVSNGTVLIEGHGDLLGRLGQLEQRCGARQWTVVDRLFPTLTSAGSSNTFTQFDMAADVPANATEIRLMVAYRAAGSSVGTTYTEPKLSIFLIARTAVWRNGVSGGRHCDTLRLLFCLLSCLPWH